ncbi:general secretion pathway protein GspB [Roseateles oligotrophus]|uniref:General secretion pathway protein GspB n=1 Tax=Roseateles oligotrophus TaxID=1769250 RepID=A0ABT2YKD0_9BURK|nr:general secretion pathway protein GspB [Roseateles oligotrophus]MCV2370511.1 general secretion pathway protein GspB [Roseateles oligotrophus]
MSYILDALRKADSDRERGAVPTLHSHPEQGRQGGNAGAQAVGLPAWGRMALAAALVILLLLLGGLATQWLKGEPPPESATTQVPTPALPAPAAVALATTATTPPLTPTLLAPPPAAPESLPVAKPLAAPAVAKGAELPILKFTELPDSIRKALPTIATSGAMYSDTPANRMLIVNGQLLHEGDQIGPELQLQSIELKSAVLVFKGQRFRINY